MDVRCIMPPSDGRAADPARSTLRRWYDHVSSGWNLRVDADAELVDPEPNRSDAGFSARLHTEAHRQDWLILLVAWLCHVAGVCPSVARFRGFLDQDKHLHSIHWFGWRQGPGCSVQGNHAAGNNADHRPVGRYVNCKLGVRDRFRPAAGDAHHELIPREEAALRELHQ